jgi:hypothetical protein
MSQDIQRPEMQQGFAPPPQQGKGGSPGAITPTGGSQSEYAKQMGGKGGSPGAMTPQYANTAMPGTQELAVMSQKQPSGKGGSAGALTSPKVGALRGY